MHRVAQKHTDQHINKITALQKRNAGKKLNYNKPERYGTTDKTQHKSKSMTT